MKFAAALALALLASSASAQSPAPAREWSVETPKEADAALRFGVPDTDDQPMAFVCARGSGQVKVSAELAKRLAVREVGGAWVDKVGIREPWPMSVALTTEGASVTLRGAGHASEITEGTLVTAEFSTRAPFTAALRKSGQVQLSASGETVQPPPVPKGMVRKFLGACK